MNWRAIIAGALAFWIVTTIVGMVVTGAVIHRGVLDPIYRANEAFWLPELAQDPPDMGALLPRWMTMAFLTSLVIAGIYTCVRGSFSGSGLKRGMMYGLSLGILLACWTFSWSGIFNLPGPLWLWWAIDGLILYTVGGAAMGWVVDKWGGVEA